MASPALNQPEFQPLELSAATDFQSLADLSFADLTSSVDEAPFLTHPADQQIFATADGLKGARAAIVAIALEVSAAVFLYGIWYAWHSLR